MLLGGLVSLKNYLDYGTSLVIQWLRLRALNAGGLGLIPGWGTRAHMLQLKILHATTKTEDPVVLQLRPGVPNK